MEEFCVVCCADIYDTSATIKTQTCRKECNMSKLPEDMNTKIYGECITPVIARQSAGGYCNN